MTDLAAWLLEQIAEDEAVFRSPEWYEVELAKRMLAECEAKRFRVGLHSLRLVTINDYEMHAPNTSACRGCSYDADSMGADEYTPYPCRTLRAETLPYRDRPGYREEWRP